MISCMYCHAEAGHHGCVKCDVKTLLTTLQTEVEKLRQHGDFAGIGVMSILGMTEEELTHDAQVHDAALDDVLSIISKLKGEA